MLRLGRSRVDVAIRTVMLVDSLDMSEADRELIAQNCLQAPESRILVTHGTDTMVETARVIASRVEGKTVVLTGAMVPYAFGSSDGLFNLGSALSFAQVLPPGVYVAMNGRYFPWDRVSKNRKTGVFEETGAGGLGAGTRDSRLRQTACRTGFGVGEAGFGIGIRAVSFRR